MSGTENATISPSSEDGSISTPALAFTSSEQALAACANSSSPICYNTALSGANIITNLWLSAVLGALCYIGFIIYRGKFRFYEARLDMPQVTHKPPELNKKGLARVWSWIKPVFLVSDEDLLLSAGMDALVAVRILSFGIMLFLPITFFALVILLPIHYLDDWYKRQGAEAGVQDSYTTVFVRLTMSNMSPGSPLLWVHFVFLYAAVFWSCWLITEHYKEYISLRQSYILRSMKLPKEASRLGPSALGDSTGHAITEAQPVMAARSPLKGKHMLAMNGSRENNVFSLKKLVKEQRPDSIANGNTAVDVAQSNTEAAPENEIAGSAKTKTTEVSVFGTIAVEEGKHGTIGAKRSSSPRRSPHRNRPSRLSGVRIDRTSALINHSNPATMAQNGTEAPGDVLKEQQGFEGSSLHAHDAKERIRTPAAEAAKLQRKLFANDQGPTSLESSSGGTEVTAWKSQSASEVQSFSHVAAAGSEKDRRPDEIRPSSAASDATSQPKPEAAALQSGLCGPRDSEEERDDAAAKRPSSAENIIEGKSESTVGHLKVQQAALGLSHDEDHWSSRDYSADLMPDPWEGGCDDLVGVREEEATTRHVDELGKGPHRRLYANSWQRSGIRRTDGRSNDENRIDASLNDRMLATSGLPSNTMARSANAETYGASSSNYRSTERSQLTASLSAPSLSEMSQGSCETGSYGLVSQAGNSAGVLSSEVRSQSPGMDLYRFVPNPAVAAALFPLHSSAAQAVAMIRHHRQTSGASASVRSAKTTPDSGNTPRNYGETVLMPSDEDVDDESRLPQHADGTSGSGSRHGPGRQRRSRRGSGGSGTRIPNAPADLSIVIQKVTEFAEKHPEQVIEEGEEFLRAQTDGDGTDLLATRRYSSLPTSVAVAPVLVSPQGQEGIAHRWWSALSGSGNRLKDQGRKKDIPSKRLYPMPFSMTCKGAVPLAELPCGDFLAVNASLYTVLVTDQPVEKLRIKRPLSNLDLWVRTANRSRKESAAAAAAGLDDTPSGSGAVTPMERESPHRSMENPRTFYFTTDAGDEGIPPSSFNKAQSAQARDEDSSGARPYRGTQRMSVFETVYRESEEGNNSTSQRATMDSAVPTTLHAVVRALRQFTTMSNPFFKDSPQDHAGGKTSRRQEVSTPRDIADESVMSPESAELVNMEGGGRSSSRTAAEWQLDGESPDEAKDGSKMTLHGSLRSMYSGQSDKSFIHAADRPSRLSPGASFGSSRLGPQTSISFRESPASSLPTTEGRTEDSTKKRRKVGKVKFHESSTKGRRESNRYGLGGAIGKLRRRRLFRRRNNSIDDENSSDRQNQGDKFNDMFDPSTSERGIGLSSGWSATYHNLRQWWRHRGQYREWRRDVRWQMCRKRIRAATEMFTELFGDDFDSIVPVYDTREVDKLIHLWDTRSAQLERAQFRLKALIGKRQKDGTNSNDRPREKKSQQQHLFDVNASVLDVQGVVENQGNGTDDDRTRRPVEKGTNQDDIDDGTDHQRAQKTGMFSWIIKVLTFPSAVIAAIASWKSRRREAAVKRLKKKIGALALEVMDLQESITNAREAVLSDLPSTCFFATFKSQKAAAIAAQANLNPVAQRLFKVEPAPSPDDVNWPSITRSWWQRQSRPVYVLPLILFIMLLPIGAFTGAFAQLTLTICGNEKEGSQDAISPNSWYCSDDQWAAFFRNLVTSMAPSILLSLYHMVLLPVLVYYAAQAEGQCFSLSQLDRRCCSLFFYWDVFNVFLGAMLGGSILSELTTYIDNPSQIWNTLSASIPASSNFFVNYVAYRAFVMAWFRLFYPHQAVMSCTLKWLHIMPWAETPRDRALEAPVRNCRYGRDIGIPVLMNYVMVWAYALVSPIILPLGVLYFILLWAVWRYQMLYVYQRQYESGGQFWPVVAHRVVACIFICVLFTSTVLILKSAWTQAAIILLTLPLYLLRFDLYLSARYDAVVEQVPLMAVHSAGKVSNVDSDLWTPPPLRAGAAGWNPEWGKVWQWWGIMRYTL